MFGRGHTLEFLLDKSIHRSDCYTSPLSPDILNKDGSQEVSPTVLTSHFENCAILERRCWNVLDFEDFAKCKPWAYHSDKKVRLHVAVN